MKSPLFTIQLEAEKLRSLTADESQETALTEIDRISKSVLEDVIDLKHKIKTVMKLMETRCPEMKRAEISLIVERTVNRYKDLLKNRIVFELDLDKDADLLALDEILIEEALTNLIENAIEALPQGGKIKLTTTVIHSPVLKTKKAVEIEIEDNGIGIPADRLRDVFKAYYSTKKDGTGIGLPIARRIIETHGGRIEVQSKEGVGTRFAVFLPWKG
jgi:signal transduction histidine kinase